MLWVWCCIVLAASVPIAQSRLLTWRRADEVIVTTEENVVDAVKRITSRKLAYAAVDCVAGEMTGTIAAAVRPHGTVLVGLSRMQLHAGFLHGPFLPGFQSTQHHSV